MFDKMELHYMTTREKTKDVMMINWVCFFLLSNPAENDIILHLSVISHFRLAGMSSPGVSVTKDGTLFSTVAQHHH